MRKTVWNPQRRSLTVYRRNTAFVRGTICEITIFRKQLNVLHVLFCEFLFMLCLLLYGSCCHGDFKLDSVCFVCNIYSLNMPSFIYANVRSNCGQDWRNEVDNSQGKSVMHSTAILPLSKSLFIDNNYFINKR